MKKRVIKALQLYINKQKVKLENLFQKEDATEKELMSYVRNIHQASIQLRQAKFDDTYEYTEKDGKYYTEVLGHRIHLL